MAADIAELGIRITQAGAEATVRQLDRVAASTDKAEASAKRFTGTTDGLTAAQRFLQQQGLQLESVLARVNGETATLTQSESTLTNRYEENRAVVLQHIRALEMDAAANEQAGAAAGIHGLQLGRLNMELGTAIGRFTGVNTAATRFAAMLGGAVAGYGTMIAISLAITAAAKAYEHLTEATRKAKEEQDKLTDSLEKWYAVQKRGAAGERSQQVEAEAAKVRQLQSQYDQQIAIVNAANKAGPRAPNVVVQQGKDAAAQAAVIKAQLDAAKAAMQGGQADINKTLTEAIDQRATAYVEDLANLIRSNHATAAEIANAKALIKDFDQQLNGAARNASPAVRSQLADWESTLQNAFKKDATATTKLFNEQINDILKGMAALKSKSSVQFADVDGAKQIAELAKMLNAAEPKIEKIAAANEKATGRAEVALGKATIKAAEYEAELTKIRDTLANDLVSGIERFATRGLDSFQQFATQGASLAHKMVTDIGKDLDDLHKKLAIALVTGDDKTVTQLLPAIQKLQSLQNTLGPVSIGFSGLSAGFSAGQTAGDAAGGALLGGATGAAQGALIGSTVLPGIGTGVGALIGGLSGLVGGLLGGSSAAQELAKSVADMQRQFQISLLTFERAAGDATDLQVALAKLQETEQQLIAQAKDAGGLIGVLNGQTEANIAKIERDTRKQKALAEAQDAVDKKTQQESLQARLLRAQGNTVGADALDLQAQQQQEMNKLLASFGVTSINQIKDPAEKATAALLQQVQAQERLKGATDALNDANENLVAGYKLNLALYKYSPALGPGDPTPFTPPMPPTPTGGRPSPVSGSGGRPSPGTGAAPDTQMPSITLPVTLQVDGREIARVVVHALENKSQQQYGTTARWSEVLMD